MCIHCMLYLYEIQLTLATQDFMYFHCVIYATKYKYTIQQALKCVVS